MIDVSEPFLVLVGEPYERDRRPPVYDLRLVNPTAATLENVCTDTGGWYSEDAGVVNASGKNHSFGDVPPGGSVTIEEPDVDELSDFVISWTVTYGNPPKKLDFSLFKDRDGVAISRIPVIGGSGVLIPRA